MASIQLSDYPNAKEVFERNDCEALFESHRGTSNVILKIKRPGSRKWNIMHHYPANQLPDPADEEACAAFWNRIWQTYKIFPKHMAAYTIVSEAVWIATKERQPDDNQPVLAYGELLGARRCAHAATYRLGADSDHPRFEYLTSDARCVALYNVTHWLPIPNNPSRA